MLVEYRMAVKGFIDGLDKMSTGRLCFEILDPIALSRLLRTISKNIEGTEYELAFPHTYQYYAEPMISFANSPDYLIIQIPIFLRYKFQPLMSLFSTDVVPVPYTHKLIWENKINLLRSNFEKVILQFLVLNMSN